MVIAIHVIVFSVLIYAGYRLYKYFSSKKI